MKSHHRLSDLFALFFDPRVPILFILGSVVLAVVGNGVYDLLLKWRGETVPAIGGIVISAVLIFIVITFGFWALLRRWTRDVLTVVPSEQQAEPHAGLILSVGPDPKAAARKIIEWHMQNHTLRHCWMIVSPQVEDSQHFRDLRFWLLEHNVEPHTLRVSDPELADLSYDAVRQAVEDARRKLDGAPFIVDITGGLKPMTAGAVLACRDFGVAMQYLKAQRDKDGKPIPAKSRPMKVELQRTNQGQHA
jgi:hypothetical protein